MRLTTAVCALAILACSAPSRADVAPRELTRADAGGWLDGFFPYALARGDIAGAAVVIVKDGEILAQRGFGFADTAKETRVDPDRTLFRTGSVGKLFTWTAVLQQVESGKLDLERDVNDYLDFRIPRRDGKPVTLRNLMTHTPGFEEAVKRLVTDEPRQLLTIEQYVKAWVPERIFAPGEVPAYSNYGATLAGYIVERVSGETYDDYVDRHVFAPLGMTRSTTRQPVLAHLEESLSRGYLQGSGPAQPFEHFGVAPAGSATTTAADMGRFMIAWLQEGEYQGARILGPETVRLALGTPLTIVPPLNRMLLGFFEQSLGGRWIVGHDGDTQFFHSSLNLLVDEGVGVYVVVNSTGRDGAAGALLTAFMHGFADRYFPAPVLAETVGAEAARAHARQMLGTYQGSRRQESNFLRVLALLSQTTVTLDEDGGLLVPALKDSNGAPMKWREVRPYVWHQVGGKERLAARVEHGHVELFSVDSVSPFLMLQPVPWWKSSTILLPLLGAALAIIFVALVTWPAAALLRRHYGLWPANAGVAGRPYRWARIAGVGALLALAGWTVVFSQLNGNLFAYSPVLDPWIGLLKLATLVSCAGGTAAALRDSFRRWKQRGWAARTGSVLLVVSFATLLWLAVMLELAGFGTDY